MHKPILERSFLFDAQFETILGYLISPILSYYYSP